MATQSRRHQLLLEFGRRLEAIRVGEEIDEDAVFETDAGANVWLGETPGFGENDPDVAIGIVPGDEEPTRNAENVIVELPVEIQAVANADLDEPWLAVEQVLADVKRALELEDRLMGGLLSEFMTRGATRTISRQDGSTAVGFGLTYVCVYREKWGHP